MKLNLTEHLSSVYSVTITLHFLGLASSPSSGGSNVYMRQSVCVVWLSRLSAGRQSTKTSIKNLQTLPICTEDGMHIGVESVC
jgi:hypothetical protein